MIRISFAALIVIFLFSCQGKKTEQETVSNSKQETELNSSSEGGVASIRNIEDIRSEFDFITSQRAKKQLDTASFSYDCYGEKNGKVTYLSDKTGVRMIVHSYSEYSHFSATDQYYIKDNQLFFAFYDEVGWSFDEGSQSENGTKDEIVEKRFYFVNQESIKCLEKKFTTKSSSEENPQSVDTPNQEVDCNESKAVLKKFEMLLKLKDKEEEITCLDEIG